MAKHRMPYCCVHQSIGRKRSGVCSQYGDQFADQVAVCGRADVKLVHVCTFPDYRLEPVKLCASLGKPVQLQKPIARTLAEARQILEIANRAGTTVGVVNQHRFDDSSQFLHRAITAGRLGRILKADSYVKWYRSPAYYGRSVKGGWAVEGGGALINQAIHQVDLVRWLIGPVRSVKATWQLGAIHTIESEDIVNALLTFENGASGVNFRHRRLFGPATRSVQIHGSRGSAIVTGDRLTAWDVQDDHGDPAPLTGGGALPAHPTPWPFR